MVHQEAMRYLGDMPTGPVCSVHTSPNQRNLLGGHIYLVLEAKRRLASSEKTFHNLTWIGVRTLVANLSRQQIMFQGQPICFYYGPFIQDSIS